jgi:hypothetical protein
MTGILLCSRAGLGRAITGHGRVALARLRALDKQVVSLLRLYKTRNPRPLRNGRNIILTRADATLRRCVAHSIDGSFGCLIDHPRVGLSAR